MVHIREPGDDEAVLVRVVGAGICRTDLRLWGVRSLGGFNLPFLLGHENAGVVERVGKRVVGFSPGDRVLVYSIWSDLSCRYCRVGLYMQCRSQSIPGQSRFLAVMLSISMSLAIGFLLGLMV